MVNHFLSGFDQRLFVIYKLLDLFVILEHYFVSFDVHAVADAAFNVWYFVEPVINILNKRFSDFTAENKNNSYCLLNGLKSFVLIVKLKNFPVSQGIIMLELIAAVIELCNVITKTYDCSLFDVFVRFQQVLERKLDHDNGLQIGVLLFNEFLFNSQYLVGEIWE